MYLRLHTHHVELGVGAPPDCSKVQVAEPPVAHHQKNHHLGDCRGPSRERSQLQVNSQDPRVKNAGVEKKRDRACLTLARSSSRVVLVTVVNLVSWGKTDRKQKKFWIVSVGRRGSLASPSSKVRHTQLRLSRCPSPYIIGGSVNHLLDSLVLKQFP